MKKLIIILIITVIIVAGVAVAAAKGLIPWLGTKTNIKAGIFHQDNMLDKDAKCTNGAYCKPVIYLYPPQEQKVSVKIDFPGKIIVSAPQYNVGWKIIAHPDGKIIDPNDNQEYKNLFWEGQPQTKPIYDLSTGFIVSGQDTKSFLEQTLRNLGLNQNEISEFIAYWQPQMENNQYNLIHFATDQEYANIVPLSINPQPDSILRVFMVYKPLEQKIIITPQTIKPFVRNGFAVIEWGGTMIK